MPIPDFQTLMLSLLRAAEDGRELSMDDVRARLANEFNLTESERIQLIPAIAKQSLRTG